jgi:uncharacterized protein YaaR (DUF327 family)
MGMMFGGWAKEERYDNAKANGATDKEACEYAGYNDPWKWPQGESRDDRISRLEKKIQQLGNNDPKDTEHITPVIVEKKVIRRFVEDILKKV